MSSYADSVRNRNQVDESEDDNSDASSRASPRVDFSRSRASPKPTSLASKKQNSSTKQKEPEEDDDEDLLIEDEEQQEQPRKRITKEKPTKKKAKTNRKRKRTDDDNDNEQENSEDSEDEIQSFNQTERRLLQTTSSGLEPREKWLKIDPATGRVVATHHIPKMSSMSYLSHFVEFMFKYNSSITYPNIKELLRGLQKEGYDAFLTFWKENLLIYMTLCPPVKLTGPEKSKDKPNNQSESDSSSETVSSSNNSDTSSRSPSPVTGIDVDGYQEVQVSSLNRIPDPDLGDDIIEEGSTDQVNLLALEAAKRLANENRMASASQTLQYRSPRANEDPISYAKEMGMSMRQQMQKALDNRMERLKQVSTDDDRLKEAEKITKKLVGPLPAPSRDVSRSPNRSPEDSPPREEPQNENSTTTTKRTPAPSRKRGRMSEDSASTLKSQFDKYLRDLGVVTTDAKAAQGLKELFNIAINRATSSA